MCRIVWLCLRIGNVVVLNRARGEPLVAALILTLWPHGKKPNPCAQEAPENTHSYAVVQCHTHTYIYVLIKCDLYLFVEYALPNCRKNTFYITLAWHTV